MSVSKYCNHNVVTARPEETVRTAAQRLVRHAVGALVVTEHVLAPQCVSLETRWSIW